MSKTDKTLNKDVKHQLEAPFCKPSLVTGEGLTTLPIDNHETTASREAERIHLENIDRLSAMPQESIILEQDKLLKSLGMSDFSYHFATIIGLLVMSRFIKFEISSPILETLLCIECGSVLLSRLKKDQNVGKLLICQPILIGHCHINSK